MRLVAKTAAVDLDKEISIAINSATAYYDEHDPAMRRLRAEIEKLGKTDAAGMSVLLTRFYVLLGDRAQSDYWSRNASKLHAPRINIELSRMICYVNLGFYTDSIEPMSFVTDPEHGMMSSEFFEAPMGNGAFQLLCAHYEKATAMSIANLPPLCDNIAAAARAMEFWNETDRDYTAALDIAGAVLRSRRLFMSESGFLSQVVPDIDGSGPTVRLSIAVKVDFETSMDMTAEYLDRLAESGVKIPQSMTFQFVSEEHV